MSDAAHAKHRRNPYIRPMTGWWRRDGYFMRYMARELTAFAVLAYSVMLAVGLVRLAQGEAAWREWVEAMASPLGLAAHVVLLVSMAVHTRSWFQIMPKTMPAIRTRKGRVGAAAITGAGLVAALAATALVLALAWRA